MAVLVPVSRRYQDWFRTLQFFRLEYRVLVLVLERTAERRSSGIQSHQACPHAKIVEEGHVEEENWGEYSTDMV